MKAQIAQWISEIVDSHFEGHLTSAQVYKRIGDCYVHPASHVCDDVTEWVITHRGKQVAHAFDIELAKKLFNRIHSNVELRRVDSRGCVHLEMVRH